MDSPVAKIREFVAFVRQHLTGDEKGEAQVFCDRLFQAFGQPGIFEAGGALEYRIHKGKTTRFADLLWRPRLLLEMKKKGEKLERHYRQVFDYWLYLVPNRPQYVVLCNFDEFWIYDFNIQMEEPVDRVRLDDLPRRFEAFSFLFPAAKPPIFQNNLVAVTRKAADKVALLFNHLTQRPSNPLPRDKAQRYVLQCVLALFAQSIDLLPHAKFSELLHECKNGASSYDLIGDLFRQMANPTPAEGGRYQDVKYFDGGLFEKVEPVGLSVTDLWLLDEAAQEDWSMVKPAIFGTLFEGSMDGKERHAFGAHFTSEADIQKVVLPTIVRPWRERIADAKTGRQLLDLRQEMLRYRVLDPACGSGNFLYVAYRELKRLELELLEKIYDNFGDRTRELAGATSLVSAGQFFGIDIKPFAVELAKVTLMLAKTLALQETRSRLAGGQRHLPFDLSEEALPLDNLDRNFLVGDALLDEWGEVRPWPAADVIIGNPPFIGSKRLKPLRGAEYVNKLRKVYRGIPGLADYCVFWFRRSHDHIPTCTVGSPTSGRAGLVGTQNVRNNKSREGGLDHIVHTGTIIEAVDNQPWSGEADVHVSIVNWVKSHDAEVLPERRQLWTQLDPKATKKGGMAGNGQTASSHDLVFRDVEFINSSLSDETDVSGKHRLNCNLVPKRCFQGKIPGYEGFLIGPERAAELRRDSGPVIVPYLTGRELLDEFRIDRWAIDFGNRDMLEAAAFHSAFEHCKARVLPEVEASYKQAAASDSDMADARKEHLNRWWQFWNRRDELSAVLRSLPRYIGCSRVTRRPVIVFLSSAICPSDLVQVFALGDDYSFGVLQSALHFEWFRKSSRMKVESDTRYSVREVFETFPWPQSPSLGSVAEVAAAARSLRAVRQAALVQLRGGLRTLYRTLELPGRNVLRDAQSLLDDAVRRAYGMEKEGDILAFLLELNRKVYASEIAGQHAQRPGLPDSISDPTPFTSDDCLTA